MIRLVINLALAALFVLGAALFVRNTGQGAFSGEALLPLQGRSGVAIARSGVNNLVHLPRTHAVYTGQTLEALAPILPPQAFALLDPQPLYDAVLLPFSLELDSTTFIDPGAATHTLTIEDGAGAERTIEAAEGESLALADGAYTVSALRTWSGLLPSPRGRPMAALALAIGDAPWIEHIVAHDADWTLFEPEGAVRLVWTDDEAAARLDDGGSQSMRWGVEEGDLTHWFDGAAPGAGLTLNDGRTVTLLALEDEGEPAAAAIKVSVEGPEGTELFRIEANRTSPGGLVRFDYPAARRYRFSIAAWQEDKALIGGYVDGSPIESVTMERGAVAAIPGTDLRIRLDGVHTAALRVREPESTVSECLLEGDGRMLRLRHGERVRLGAGAVTYRRVATPALAELRIVAHHRETGQVTTKLLRPNESFRVLRWRIVQKPLPMEGLDAFVIGAVFEPGVRLPAWMGAGLCVVSGALLAVRGAAFFWRRRTRLS